MAPRPQTMVLLVAPAHEPPDRGPARTASDSRRWWRAEAATIARRASAPADEDASTVSPHHRDGFLACWAAFVGVRRSDVVHLQEASSWMSAACALSAWIYRRPMLVAHAERPRRPRRVDVAHLVAAPLEGWVVRAAARVEVLDPSGRDRMLAHGVEPQRISLLVQGVDLDIFRPVTPEVRAVRRRRYGLPPDETLVLFGETATPPDPPLGYRPVRVVASGEGQAAGGALVVLAAADSRQRAEIYQACDAFVRPEAAGGLTLAAQHAMACGLPVVAADDLCVEEYGLDRDGLRLYPPSVDDLRAAVDDVLADGATRARMGAYSRRTSDERFSWTRHAAAHLRLYEELTAPKRPGDPVLRSETRPPRSRTATIALIAIAVAFVVALGLLLRGPLAHQASLSLQRQPARYTQVFFPTPVALPSEVRAGARLAFVFAVANQGTAAADYRYTVTESGAAGSLRAESGNLRVGAGQTLEHRVDIGAAPLGTDLTVRVSVAPSGLFVALHVRETGA